MTSSIFEDALCIFELKALETAFAEPSGFAKEGIFYYTAVKVEGYSAGVSASTRADVWIEERRITTQHEDIVRLIVQFAAPSCFLLKYKTTLEIIRVGGGGGEPQVPIHRQRSARARGFRQRVPQWPEREPGWRLLLRRDTPPLPAAPGSGPAERGGDGSKPLEQTRGRSRCSRR